jgi:hypothetical protein
MSLSLRRRLSDIQATTVYDTCSKLIAMSVSLTHNDKNKDKVNDTENRRRLSHSFLVCVAQSGPSSPCADTHDEVYFGILLN